MVKNLGNIVKMRIFMTFQGSNRGPKACETSASTALFVSISRAAKKLVFINSAHKLLHFCQQIIQRSGNGVEQMSRISHIFNLTKIDCVRF